MISQTMFLLKIIEIQIEENDSIAIGLYCSSTYLERCRKCSDIHTQSQLNIYQGALYFGCNY